MYLSNGVKCGWTQVGLDWVRGIVANSCSAYNGTDFCSEQCSMHWMKTSLSVCNIYTKRTNDIMPNAQWSIINDQCSLI
jgi:hypothetical protein